MLSRYWQDKPLCIKVTWSSKTAHMCTYAYMSVETADIPLSVNHPTHGGLLYNVPHQEKSTDHLAFTYRLNIITIRLMLPQCWCKVCITLFVTILKRVLCFIRIHSNDEKYYYAKKSSYGIRNLNDVKVFSCISPMKIIGCPALIHFALKRKYLLNLCMA